MYVCVCVRKNQQKIQIHVRHPTSTRNMVKLKHVSRCKHYIPKQFSEVGLRLNSTELSIK